MQETTTKKIYDLQSLVYDITFAKLVKRRVAEAIKHMNIADGERVLDLGIGTGQSLNYYPPRSSIVGIDLSDGMLREARKRIRERGWDHVQIVQANALTLPFPDDCFDHVFISHVISVVSDPVMLVKEAQRVAKPDARIVVVNHFQSSNRFVAMIEKWLCPLCTRLGWRSDLALPELIRNTGMQIDYRYKLDTVDLWETVVMTNNKSALAT